MNNFFKPFSKSVEDSVVSTEISFVISSMDEEIIFLISLSLTFDPKALSKASESIDIIS